MFPILMKYVLNGDYEWYYIVESICSHSEKYPFASH